MLIVNAAPVDQSGRTLRLAKYFTARETQVVLLTYRGLWGLGAEPEGIRCVYIREIPTAFWGIRWALLLIKLLYLSLAVSLQLIRYRIERYVENGYSASVDPEYTYSTNCCVLFVAPPLATAVLPSVLARILGMDVLVDWHRVDGGSVLEKAAVWAVGSAWCFAVTGSMKKYLVRKYGLEVLTLRDVDLALYLKDAPRFFGGRNPGRKRIFAYLQKRYPEFSEDFKRISMDACIAVCSTSCSAEENIPGLLRILQDLEVPSGGTFLFTTKKRIRCKTRGLVVARFFLSPEDYFLLLHACDLGISTHLCHHDFPLKVVDYVQCGLPVIAHCSTPEIEQSKIPNSITRYKTDEQLGKLITQFYNREPHSTNTKT